MGDEAMGCTPLRPGAFTGGIGRGPLGKEPPAASDRFVGTFLRLTVPAGVRVPCVALYCAFEACVAVPRNTNPLSMNAVMIVTIARSESRPPTFERVEKRIHWPHFQIKNTPDFAEEMLLTPFSSRGVETDQRRWCNYGGQRELEARWKQL